MHGTWPSTQLGEPTAERHAGVLRPGAAARRPPVRVRARPDAVGGGRVAGQRGHHLSAAEPAAPGPPGEHVLAGVRGRAAATLLPAHRRRTARAGRLQRRMGPVPGCRRRTTDSTGRRAMNVHSDELVDDYLRRLDAAASALPAHRREELISEIRDHLEEAMRREPASDEAAVRNVLERLGLPEEIVSAAQDPAPPGHLVAPYRETNGSAIVSVLLGVLWFAWIGSVLALFFGYRARREIKNSAGRQKGSGLATVGIILGWIGIAILLAGVAAGVVLVASSAGSSGGTPVPAHSRGGTPVPVHSP